MANPRRALAIVIGVVFIDLVGFGIVIPILPFYTVAYASPFLVGALLLVPVAVALGRLVD